MSVEPAPSNGPLSSARTVRSSTTIAQALGVKPQSRAWAEIVRLMHRAHRCRDRGRGRYRPRPQLGQGGQRGRRRQHQHTGLPVSPRTQCGPHQALRPRTGGDNGAPAVDEPPPSGSSSSAAPPTWSTPRQAKPASGGSGARPAPGPAPAPATAPAPGRPTRRRQRGRRPGRSDTAPAGSTAAGREGQASGSGRSRPAGRPSSRPATAREADDGQRGGDQGRGEQGEHIDVNEPGNRRRRRRGRRGKDDQTHVEEFAGEPVEVEGLLDLRGEGYGFLRVKGYLPSKDDIYVSVKQVRQFGLRKGDHVSGASRPPCATRRTPPCCASTRSTAPTPSRPQAPPVRGPDPALPDDKLRSRLERRREHDGAHRRPHRTDRQGPARAHRVAAEGRQDHHREADRPVGRDQQPRGQAHGAAGRRAAGRGDRHAPLAARESSEVVASTFDRPAEEHTQVAELTIERAKRLVEDGNRRLHHPRRHHPPGPGLQPGRPATGRIMSGGVDSGALYPPKEFFGAATTSRRAVR